MNLRRKEKRRAKNKEDAEEENLELDLIFATLFDH